MPAVLFQYASGPMLAEVPEKRLEFGHLHGDGLCLRVIGRLRTIAARDRSTAN